MHSCRLSLENEAMIFAHGDPFCTIQWVSLPWATSGQESNCTPAKPFPPSHQTEAIMNMDRRFVANFFFKPNHKFGCSTWTIAVPCLVSPCFPKRIGTGRRVSCDGIPTWPAARRIQPTRWLGCVECTPDFFLSRVMQGFLCRLVWLQSSNLTLASGLLSQGVMSRALGANIWPASHIAVGGGASIGSGAEGTN